VIIGGGPAAYTAAIYASRAELQPLVFEGYAWGGQLFKTTDVENFPGFPKGVNGPELVEGSREQAKRFGAEFLSEDVIRVDLTKRPFLIESKETKVRTKTLIIATGADAKRMDIPGAGDDEYWSKGISACAVCDGALPLFRNRPLFVIGGGDSACEEASFLTKFGSKVYVVHRRDQLRASKIMQQRLLKNPKVEMLWNHVVTKVEGDTKVITKVSVQNVITKEERVMEAGGLFFAIGHTPNTKFLEGSGLKFDDTKYLITEPGSTKTNIPGVFACGDCQDKKWRQAITAAGTGCMAALEAEHLLAEDEVAEGDEEIVPKKNEETQTKKN